MSATETFTNPCYFGSAMAGGDRMRRIDEVMRKVIGSAIASDLEDPRIGFVTVTSVKTSPDLRSARVYVSVLGDEAEREDTLAALASSHGKLQAAIAREVLIKHTPTLKFFYDDSLERGVRLAQLLEEGEGERDE